MDDQLEDRLPMDDMERAMHRADRSSSTPPSRQTESEYLDNLSLNDLMDDLIAASRESEPYTEKRIRAQIEARCASSPLPSEPPPPGTPYQLGIRGSVSLDVETARDEAASPATPAELTEALNAVLDAKRWLLESEGYTDDHKEFCRERFSNARSALLALYDRQREEIERLDQLVFDQNAEADEAFQASEQGKELIALRGEVSALSSQLERLIAENAELKQEEGK